METYIDFVEREPNPKTRVWSVVTNTPPRIPLGQIRWFSRWRCYAFFPEKDTVFEHDCLRHIAGFCETATQEHKAKRRAA